MGITRGFTVTKDHLEEHLNAGGECSFGGCGKADQREWGVPRRDLPLRLRLAAEASAEVAARSASAATTVTRVMPKQTGPQILSIPDGFSWLRQNICQDGFAGKKPRAYFSFFSLPGIQPQGHPVVFSICLSFEVSYNSMLGIYNSLY